MCGRLSFAGVKAFPRALYGAEIRALRTHGVMGMAKRRENKEEEIRKIEYDGVDGCVPIEETWEPILVDVKMFARTLYEAEVQAIYYGIIKPLRCRKCNLYFTTRGELMRHIWEFHRTSVGGENGEG
jgi:hypothetical protein